MKNKQSIAIIGGLGRVGLPLGLLFANKNFNVNLIDINIDKKNEILNGKIPFYEIDGKKIFEICTKKK